MNKDDFLVEDYKLKLDYLKSQFDRLWTRFNFFLSVEVALFGFLGWLVFEKHNPNATPLPALLGLSVSLLWYVIGAQDRALVEFYRLKVNEAAKRIASNGRDDLKWYRDEHAAVEAQSIFKGITSWYWKKVSITRIPVIVSLMLFTVWLALLFWGKRVFEKLL